MVRYFNKPVTVADRIVAFVEGSPAPVTAGDIVREVLGSATQIQKRTKELLQTSKLEQDEAGRFHYWYPGARWPDEYWYRSGGVDGPLAYFCFRRGYRKGGHKDTLCLRRFVDGHEETLLKGSWKVTKEADKSTNLQVDKGAS